MCSLEPTNQSPERNLGAGAGFALIAKAVPGFFAHHHQGIYIGRCFDERSADARIAWNVETPTNVNTLIMVIEAPSAAADGAQHFRGG
jgi:hypothetical protein